MHLPATAETGTASGGQATVEDPVFSCRDVRVFYGAKEALKSVTIDVGRRQVLVGFGDFDVVSEHVVEAYLDVQPGNGA